MRIWVDADACPGEVKELLFRAAQRTKRPRRNNLNKFYFLGDSV